MCEVVCYGVCLTGLACFSAQMKEKLHLGRKVTEHVTTSVFNACCFGYSPFEAFQYLVWSELT